MRCLVGVMAVAALAFVATPQVFAASLVAPTICTNTFNGINTCDSGAGGLSVVPPGGTISVGDVVDNDPLVVTVNGNPFDVANDTLNLAAGETATIRMEIRNFRRVWFDVFGLSASPNGPTESGGDWVAGLQTLRADTGYTIPVNISVAGNAPGILVSVTDAEVLPQVETVELAGPFVTEGTTTLDNLSGDESSNIDSIRIEDSMGNTLDSTGDTAATAFKLRDYLDSGEDSLDLLAAAATGDLQLVIEDGADLPRSFAIEFTVQAVPLPAAAWLFLSGLAALAGFRRFRSKAA